MAVAPAHFGPILAKPPARHAFERIDEIGNRDLGRIVHEKVDVIVLAVALDKLGLEILADLGEYTREVFDRERR